MNKLVSVVIPIYNTELSYLKTAIRSILDQTYQNLELILVDSSDKKDIRNMIYKQNDARIHYYFRKKHGIYDALNFGIELANGEYIARMDADDISLPKRLEKQVAFLERFPDVDVLGAYYEAIDSNGNIRENKSMFEVSDYESIKSSMIFDNPMNHPTIMFRRKIIDAGWRYHNVYGEDHDLWTRMLPTVRFANINEKLLQYRQYGGNISFQLSRFSIARNVAETTKRYIESLFSIDTTKYMLEDFAKNYYLYFFYPEIGRNFTEYFMRQFSLLVQIYLQNETMHLIEPKALVLALNRRWITLMGVADYIVPELKDLYTTLASQFSETIFFADNLSKFYGYNIPDYEKVFLRLKNSFQENERLFEKLLSEEKSFLMYGMGEQGQIMLEKCEHLKKTDKFLWHLKGIVDRRPLTVTYMGHNYHSIVKEQIRNMDFDYILISSTWYFDDIKHELMELGIQENSILRGGGLYLLG